MAEITAALVKALREKTGAGIMACRSTLVATGGDLDAAIEQLRDAQTTMAAKKANRVAAEGLVGVALEGGRGAIVEVNCETDFVARGSEFRGAVAALAPIVLDVQGRLEALMAAPAAGGDGTVADLMARLTARTGERITVRRCAEVAAADGVVASYVHNSVAPGVGSIGVLVVLSGSAPAALAVVGRQVAMHVAASAPAWIVPGDVPEEIIAAKRTELLLQARTSGKPDAVVERMVDGRLRKFLDEVALLRQPFVMNPDLTVGEALAEASGPAGGGIGVRRFVVYRAGEGASA